MAAVQTIVIAGAGQAGGRAAEALRAAGFAGAITMVGAEPHAPYERPQLSKQFLNAPAAEVAYLKGDGQWRDDLGVDLVTGAALTAGDAARRVVADGEGREYRYDRLLIATGTVARELPLLAAAGTKVHTLRSIEDAARLRPHLHARARVVVIGGGVIGLEAASAAAKLGCEVDVVEAAPHLLARAFPKIISDVVEARHRAAGVRFHFGATVKAATAAGVELDNGARLAADIILVGVGVDPAPGLAQALGLAADGGIAVDACGATAIEGISCAGDIALQWSPWHGRRMRIETWANAQNQAIATARNMVGEPRAYTDPPWFWTDQYDLNIQVVGDLAAADLVVRGAPEGGRFSVGALRDGELVGAVAVNAAKDMASFRRLVAAHAKLAPTDLASPNFDLRKAMAS